MKCWRNGRIEELRGDEARTLHRDARRIFREERTRPLTLEEILEKIIPTLINTLPVDDNTALRMQNFYPAFEDVVDQSLLKGSKFAYGGKLWRVEQAYLKIQSIYPPGTGTESLYSEVCESHDGTEYDPIPYEGNMALENGKYYIQNDVVYVCTRDTINPVYHALAELVGLYVEVEDDYDPNTSASPETEPNTTPEWKQPDSTNPYMKGDKVTYNGKTWVSTCDNNVWAPGVYGWEEVTE